MCPSRRHNSRPLFLYINFHDTHYPYHRDGLRLLVSGDVLSESQITPSRAATIRNMYFNTAANAFVLGAGQQPGQGYTQSAAGASFGLLRQTVERVVGLGTNRQIQFALRLSF